jgi:hypothetical protein
VRSSLLRLLLIAEKPGPSRSLSCTPHNGSGCDTGFLLDCGEGRHDVLEGLLLGVDAEPELCEGRYISNTPAQRYPMKRIQGSPVSMIRP